MIKKSRKAVTLAIGDGANDVSMIKGEIHFILLSSKVSFLDQGDFDRPYEYVAGQSVKITSVKMKFVYLCFDWVELNVLLYYKVK